MVYDELDVCVWCGQSLRLSKDGTGDDRSVYMKGIGELCPDCYCSYSDDSTRSNLS